jgi:NAD(P)-dependent dehydrogenase (short-subunit alcohol dehydrogenase family)
MSAYAAAKAGVEAFGDSLRTEMLPHGVAVGVAYFSWIATDMVAGGDASAAGAILRSRMKGPIGKTYSLPVAIDAVEKGIESRARRVVAPGWARVMLAMRDILGPIQDKQLAPYMSEVERAFEEDIATRGSEASAPVGAGGAADSARRSRVAAG